MPVPVAISRLISRLLQSEPALSLFPAGYVPNVTIQPDPVPPNARPLTAEEKAILDWLLRHTPTPAEGFGQLDQALASAGCTCGCPTIAIHVPPGTPRVHLTRSSFAEAFAYVGPDQVGILLFQAGGHLTCLEIYELSVIPRPYGLPDPATLELANWPERPATT